MWRKSSYVIAALAGVTILASMPAKADTVADFYAGKTVEMPGLGQHFRLPSQSN